MLRRARDAELLDKNSIEEILMELAELRAVKVGGKWRLTEILLKDISGICLGPSRTCVSDYERCGLCNAS